MIYIVIFGSADPTRCVSLVEKIKSFGDWGELSPSSFLLNTPTSIQTMMEALQPLLGPADSLWILAATSPWSSYGDPIVEDHATAYLGEAENYVPKDWNDAEGFRR